MLPQTRQFRSRQAALRALVEQEVARLWPALDPERLDVTFPVWARGVGQVVIAQRAVSTALAARYLRDLGIAVTAAPTVPAGVLLSSLEVTSKVSIKSAMTAGTLLADAAANALSASSAAAVRHVLEGGNETARLSAVADRKVSGWRRVAAANACDYCRDRVGQFLTTADFNCHDGCNCSVEPVTI